MSEERDPLDLDAEALMNEKADNIEFVVDDSDEENHESEPEGDPEPGGVEDITILVESDDDSRGDLKPDDENSSQHSSYIDDYPDLEEVSTDQIKGSSKQISESTGKGIKRPRDSDNENSTSKKVSIHGEDTSKNNGSSNVAVGSSQEIEGPKLTTNPCFVPGCQLPKNKKVYFFRVPKNKILFQLWDLMIKRPGVRLTGQCLVCQQHFHKDDILKVEGPRESGGVCLYTRLLALKREALPCISYVQRCPVINCGLRAGRSQQFPILDKNNFSVWLERLGNPKLKFADILQILRYRVCDGHFHKKCFDENGELKSGSTPSVNIPEFPHVAYMSYPSARDLVKLPTPPLTGKCAFEKCADKAKKKQNVYPLPTNFENLVKWLAASGHPNWIATTLEKTLERVNQQVSVGFGVCLDHFTSYDFVDASLEQLANTAVPTRKGDQEPSINYAVEVKSVVPVKPGTAPPAISPAPVSAVNNNNMVILLPSNPAPVAPSIAPVSVVVPVNPAPQQTVSANVPNPIQPVLPAPPPPTNMVPLLVSNNGDTKVMLVPQEVITATNPDFLQKMLSAAVSGGQPQPAAAPSRFTEPTFLPKATPTVPKVTNNLPRIPTPKVTPSMRRTAAANITPTDTIDLTETSEKDDSNVQNELPKTSQSPAHDQFCCYNKRGCCYVGCIAEPSATNPLYTFPVDVERRKAWLQACGRTDAIYYKWLQVCKMHFTPDCFHEKGFLLPDAVPVQNQYKAPLTCSQPGSHKFHSSSNKNQQTLPKPKPLERPKPRPDGLVPCAVLRCINALEKDKCAKYRFPNPAKERDRFHAWSELVYNPVLKYEPSVIYEEFIVCERHFEPLYYEKGDKSLPLCPVAIPTVMVPGKRTLRSLQFYKDKVEPYLKEIARVTVELVETDDVSLDEKQKTICVLENDQITFPGLGNALKFSKHNLNKHAYTMYKMTKKLYSADWDLEEGENMKIHTAIIIDDNEECEKAVLQQILDTQQVNETQKQNGQ
ncbi:unnamed protein product [Callosobruchus maculatus]|uniref:THAP-type domain-containing protein n=1 Tax=Callosobruchus maculatus TaxID=64391 RepID=A0A653CMM2_CALMS|nr:unnamed protein product [Callosobruchus maculatus]